MSHGDSARGGRHGDESLTCGQLLALLDAKNLSANTLVIFLSDNGWIQDPEADRCAPRSKQSQYEGVTIKSLRLPVDRRGRGWAARRPGFDRVSQSGSHTPPRPRGVPFC